MIIILYKFLFFFTWILLLMQGYSPERLLAYFSYIGEFWSHCFTKVGLYFTHLAAICFFLLAVLHGNLVCSPKAFSEMAT